MTPIYLSLSSWHGEQAWEKADMTHASPTTEKNYTLLLSSPHYFSGGGQWWCLLVDRDRFSRDSVSYAMYPQLACLPGGRFGHGWTYAGTFAFLLQTPTAGLAKNAEPRYYLQVRGTDGCRVSPYMPVLRAMRTTLPFRFVLFLFASLVIHFPMPPRAFGIARAHAHATAVPEKIPPPPPLGGTHFTLPVRILFLSLCIEHLPFFIAAKTRRALLLRALCVSYHQRIPLRAVDARAPA